MDEPTNCYTCKASLERGYSYRYQGDVLISALCFDCDRKEVMAEYIKTKRLSTKLIMDNMSKLYDINMKDDWRFKNTDFLKQLKHRVDIQLAADNIQEKIREFEKHVWFGGLQKIVRASKVKGVSAKTTDFHNFCVLTYSMCGRTMFTIENDKNSITTITSEDGDEYGCMGLQGINATEEAALELLQCAITMDRNNELRFEDDTKVSMGL
jgi:hypothetical protein